MKTERITKLAVLTAAALILFMVESLFPPVIWFAPYVRVGISNVIVLFVLVVYGEKECLAAVVVKCVLGSLVTGTWYAFPFNIAGGLGGALAMMTVYGLFFPRVGLIAVSCCGAVVSNILRTVVGAAVMETGGLLLQMPVAAGVGVLAGALVGALAVLLIKRLPARMLR